MLRVALLIVSRRPCAAVGFAAGVYLLPALVGPIDAFEDFLLGVPEGVDVEDRTTAVVRCEAFSEFVTAARYR